MGGVFVCDNSPKPIYKSAQICYNKRRKTVKGDKNGTDYST